MLAMFSRICVPSSCTFDQTSGSETFPNEFEVDARHEVAAGARENDDLVAAIARDVVEGVDERLVVLRREVSGGRRCAATSRGCRLRCARNGMFRTSRSSWLASIHCWSWPAPFVRGYEADVVARCVEGGAELVGVAADLGEEEAAWMLAMVAVASAAGVGVVAQLAAGFHASEAVAEVRFPAFETYGDRCSGGGVALGELAGEGADRAAAARLLLDLVLDHEVEPAVDAGPGVEVVKELALPCRARRRR